MKQTATASKKILSFRRRPAYPNAAEARYYLNKALDFALATATTLGTVTIFMFLMSMS